MGVKKGEVLVVDDQLGVRALLSMALKDRGFSVETATNGQEGVDKIKEINSDLVIMDVKMPVKDGVEALYEMKNLYPNTHIIMMTAYSEGYTVEAIKKGGADKFIIKPFDIEYLMNYVDNVFAQKG
ncbi:two-component system, response regulator, stage 0 sporulation protein F [Desulfonispora thiosulfatigenes DSM 11270]|uniref:Stage 0 sporulation protein A homolog n=1 Tax=Desulfonispora thiosulfatigenes DSM 11270 TaxID=656914 RepID=A0A1W1V9N2_DESTI|nr:response regulator [Desulfonispora thiosulfatigenes]SMB89714.1 two-component system, response regulator, stage 0 sporulation protein F [Desulfonispora thiosulfatigenes DSM 11270]